jgi:hypothetical protein
MGSPPSEPALDEAIREAWEATQCIIDLQDEIQQPSDAFAFLSTGVRDLADLRSPAATVECAKRFEIVSRWLESGDGPTASQLAGVAARLRELVVPS